MDFPAFLVAILYFNSEYELDRLTLCPHQPDVYLPSISVKQIFAYFILSSTLLPHQLPVEIIFVNIVFQVKELLPEIDVEIL